MMFKKLLLNNQRMIINKNIFKIMTLQNNLILIHSCNVTPARRFWVTKVCLRASKISKICLFGYPTRRATS